ncbi:MAG: hypothetical protein WC764_01410 [Candidatus Paceibacterota bacterium]|jgi:hypothetical protein
MEKKVATATEMAKRENRSLGNKMANGLWLIATAFFTLKGTVAEFCSLTAAQAKDVAEYLLGVIRGTATMVSLEIALKLGVIEEATDVVAPEGGKVFRLTLPVDWTTAWREFILACCPQTDLTWPILTVGEQYVSPKIGRTIEVFYLVWFGKGIYSKASKALEWAGDQFVPAHGRIPAAIIGGVSSIVAQLAKFGFPYQSVGVVTASECDGGLSFAWQHADGGREAHLHTVSNEWLGNYLFVFRRK